MKILPVTILITSYNRKKLLEKTVQLINERTFYPYRIIVIDNHSTDDTYEYLKVAKVQGKIFDYIYMPKNVGQSKALNQGFKVVEDWEFHEGSRMKRPSNDFIVTTNEDIFVPALGQKKCWLTRMINILEKNEPEYGGLCMRIQRMPRTDIDENEEIIPSYKNFPSVYRLMRRSDIRKIGKSPFGTLKKWDSNSVADRYKLYIKKKFGFTTHIYANHAGWCDNRGYKENTKSFTLAENKMNIHNEKPYPDIDPLTNVPVKINHSVDKKEQELREEYQAKLNGEIKDPEVTIILLTCYRPKGLKQAIDSIRNTIDNKLYKLLVVIDNDDTEAYNYCIEQNINCILSNHQRDFVAQANLGIYTCETPYFVIVADDMEFKQDKWLEKALSLFKDKFKDNIGLMSFNEGIQHGRIFTCGMSSKKFVYKIGGYLYFPKYKHYKGDREVTELARYLNIYYYAESIKVEHYHPSNKDSSKRNEKDDTYKNSEKFLKHDRDLKARRSKEVLLKNKNYCVYEKVK